MCLMHQTRGKEPRQGSPLRAWMDGAREKDWPKRPSGSQLQEAWEKTLIGPWLLRWGSPGPCILGAARVPTSQAAVPYSLSTVSGTEFPQEKKVLLLCSQGHCGHFQLLATLSTVTCQTSLSGGFSKKEYWGVLANIGCHTLLEHYFLLH